VGNFAAIITRANSIIAAPNAKLAAMEIQQWIAAASAAQIAGVQPIVVDAHVTTVEYRLSVAVAHADPLPR
jgi:hypothetical protein